MRSEFTNEFFRGNRQRLKELYKGTAPIVLTANGLLQRNNDMPYPFRQDSSFWYATGIDIADAVLVMDGEEEYIILPKQEAHQETFDGAIDVKIVRLRSGIDEILNQNDGWARLSSRLKQVKKFATLAAPEAYIDHYSFYTNPARAALLKKVKEFNPTIEVSDLRQQFTAMRMIKQKPEIAVIQKAVDITVDTLGDIKKKLTKYAYEYEIEADLLSGFRKRGAAGTSFPSIVAAGKNACTIHYMANSGSLDRARFVLLDVGAEVENYAADIGSTYWLGDRSKREQSVYEAVVEAQAYAYSLLKPGVLLKEYEKQIEQFMGEKLRQLGLIKTHKHTDIRRYFPHAASHHVGLDAHDVTDFDVPLQAGMVVTVEPGIYIPEESIGVRIEHDVLLTDNGLDILSKKLPQ